jgi:uncharacterized protein YchJ
VVGEEEKTKFRNRVNEYWQYRIKGDIERAYQCEVPAFREKVSILQYANRFKLVKYLDAEVWEIEFKGTEASSKSKVTYVIFLRAIKDKQLSKLEEEKWMKVEGTWYHVPEDFRMKKDDSKG